MAKHAIFESSMLGSTYYAERIMDGVAKEDLDNGVVGYLAETPKEGFVYEFTKGTKAGERLVVIDAPPVPQVLGTSLRNDSNRALFFNPSGIAFRVRVLKETDEFGITPEGFDETSRKNIKVGAYVTVDANGKFVAGAIKEEESEFLGVIVGERNMGTTVAVAGGTLGDLSPIYRVKVQKLATV